MTSRLTALACGTLVLSHGGALAQSFDEPPPATAAVTAPAPAPANPAAAAARRASTGMCTIMRGDQILDQQNCKAIAAADAAAGADAPAFAKTITYVWPSGNRTVVGGSEEDFSVNGNLAVPTTDAARGQCLKVEKTGNTFCFKEGAKVRAAEAVSSTPPAPATAATSATPAAPAAAKPTETKTAAATAVAGAAATAATAGAARPIAEQLAEEVKQRQAAELEAKTLRAELARLTESEQKRAAAEAEKQKAEAEKAAAQAEKAAAEKARAEAVLNEIDAMEARCKARDAAACERALALANEAVVTGSTTKSRLQQLQELHSLALAPFGVPALAMLGGIPTSTWITGTVALLLALMMMAKRRQSPAGVPYRDEPLPSFGPATPQEPSLNPFALPPDPLPPLTADPMLRATPPPLPKAAPKAPLPPPLPPMKPREG